MTRIQSNKSRTRLVRIDVYERANHPEEPEFVDVDERHAMNAKIYMQ